MDFEGALLHRQIGEQETNEPACSVPFAYFVWLLLGFAGIHRLYLGRVMGGLAMGVMLLTSTFILPEPAKFAGHILVVTWWVADAFFIPGMARAAPSRTVRGIRPSVA